ncbi:MAG: hypothetical protein R3185_09105, partial [Candidatus Thermoplasmatota archaeon]|nr:hypothetical protein [Candidatus Thermoplasmatota archaeon]
MPKEEAREQGHEGAIPPPRVAAPRFTLEELPGPAFTCGPDGRKLRTNAPLRKLLDHPQEGAPSVMSLEEIFLLGADASEFLAEVRRWGRLSSTPQVLRTLQGERCPVLVTAQLIEDEQTLLATMDKVHRSPEHRLVRSPESPRDASLSASTWAHALEDLLDRFGLGVTINALDSQGNPKLVYINAAGARALGTTPGRALGGKPQPRFTDESEAVLRTERVRGPEGRHPTYVGEAEVLTEDDRSRIVEACVAYGTYMDRPSTLCLFQDVTLARRQQA